MTYKWNLIKLIYKDPKTKQKGCYVEKQIMVSFVPHIGLNVGLNNQPYPEKITEISYWVEENTFNCVVEDNGPGFPNTYDDYKNAYIEAGWRSKGDLE